ncbi:MAG: OmpH family outer membrane protein [Salibacteraceae bacterium]
MTTKEKIIVLILFILNALAIFAVYIFNKPPKIGYVYNDRLFSEYNAVGEVRAEYTRTVTQWENEIDSSRQSLGKAVQRFNHEYASLDEHEREERRALLNAMQESFEATKSRIEDQMREHDLKVSGVILKQIDTYVQDLGRSEGFDLIIGATDEGNMLYGGDAIDVTDKIVSGLNDKYEGL